MATIKAFTDLPQSKKMMEFLPPESADMHYIIMGDDEDPQSMVGLGEYIGMLPTIPCWSLAALIDVIPYAIHISDNHEMLLYHLHKAICLSFLQLYIHSLSTYGVCYQD